METALKIERPNSILLITKDDLVKPIEIKTIASGGINPKRFLNTEICKISYLFEKTFTIRLIKSKDNIPKRIKIVALVKLDKSSLAFHTICTFYLNIFL